MKPIFSIIAYIKIMFIKILIRPNCHCPGNSYYTNILKVFVIVFVSVTFSDAIAQTAIVVSRINDIVYIAADSRVRQGKNVVDRMICKIQRIKRSNVYFASAGIFEDSSTGFYLPDIINESFDTKKTLRENIDQFKIKVIPKIQKVLIYKKENFPKEYLAEYVDGSNRPLSVVFAGIERDSAAFHIRYFNILSHDTMQLNIISASCPAHCENGRDIRLLGLADPMEAWFKANTAKFWEVGIVNGMRKLIEAAIRYDSTKVAHPINIIQISRGSVRWIDPKPPCAEQ